MKISEPKKFPAKRAASILGGLILLLVIMAFGYDQFDKWRYRTASAFEAARWNKPDLKYRYSVTDYVIREVIKPGLTETEVNELLGTPNAVTANEDWQYETQQPGLRSFNWTGGGILIRFDETRHVIEAADHTLVD